MERRPALDLLVKHTRFRLRTLLIAVTFVAAACAWIGSNLAYYREQSAAVSRLRSVGAKILWRPSNLSWMGFLGEKEVFRDTTSIAFLSRRISEADIDDLAKCRDLTELYFQDCEIPADVLTRLIELKRLSLVRCQQTRFAAGGVARLSALESLESLWLQSCEFDAADVSSFQHSRLKKLCLCEMRIPTSAVAELRGSTSVERLRLRHTDVDDSLIPNLVAMRALRSVDLAGTKITADGISQLKAARPALEVEL